MAYDITISGSSDRAKVRNDWGPLGLSIITLGIYAIFWWYFINRELRDLGRARGVDLGKDPTMSVLAYSVGGLVIVPVFWTLITTNKRIRRAGETVGVATPLNGWIVLLLCFVTLGIGVPVYMQHHLNKVWQLSGVEGHGTQSDLARLERLSALRSTGGLSDAEYEAEKRKILG